MQTTESPYSVRVSAQDGAVSERRFASLPKARAWFGEQVHIGQSRRDCHIILSHMSGNSRRVLRDFHAWPGQTTPARPFIWAEE